MRIISDSESRQILKNDLIRQARQRYAAQLESANSEECQRIMSQIEADVEKELRRRGYGRRGKFPSGVLDVLGGGLLH